MNTPADPTARPAAPSPAPVRRRLHVGAAILVLALVPFVAKSLDVNNGLRVGTDPTTHGTTSPYSAKIGHANTGQGPYGLAVGESNYISGNGSFATGSLHYLNGSQLSALGSGHTIKDGNQQSVAMGLNNTINPLCDQSVAAGSHNLVAGRQNIALGTGLTTKSYRSVVLGSWNEHLPSVDATGWVSTNPLFIIGNGNGINNDPNKQSNALVILKNGNVGLGSNAPTQKLHVQGNALVTGNLVVSGTVNFNAPLTVGSNNGFRAATGATTGGSGSVAIGYNSIASSSQSTALGMQAKATNTSATALGYFANASGVGATALGPSANAAGAGAVAVGFHAEATGEGSIAIGDYTTAVDANSVVLGRLNKLPAGGGDPQLLVVGNGSPTTGRSNALVLTKSGKLGLGVDNPDKKLVVAGDARVTGTLYVEPRGGISMGAYEHIP